MTIAMDMNQLFHCHQIAVIAADRSRRGGPKGADCDLPSFYEKQINAYRVKRGLGEYFITRLPA